MSDKIINDDKALGTEDVVRAEMSEEEMNALDKAVNRKCDLRIMPWLIVRSAHVPLRGSNGSVRLTRIQLPAELSGSYELGQCQNPQQRQAGALVGRVARPARGSIPARGCHLLHVRPTYGTIQAQPLADTAVSPYVLFEFPSNTL